MISIPIRRILVPTDMSDFATLALQYALVFRKKLGSQITLLYAEEFEFLLTAQYPLCFYLDNVTAEKSHAHELLRDYAKRMIVDTTGVRILLLDDSPARAIVRTADDIDADLVIMGTHGRHGLHGKLVGSVTERVLRETTRPLMTVLPLLARKHEEIAIRRIFCPVDSTDVARHALEYASSFAKAFDAELIVENVAEQSGHAAASVLEAADHAHADLIVLGAQHTRFSDATVVGTTTELITRFAKQPVLTIMRGAESAKKKERSEAATPALV